MGKVDILFHSVEQMIRETDICVKVKSVKHHYKFNNIQWILRTSYSSFDVSAWRMGESTPKDMHRACGVHQIKKTNILRSININITTNKLNRWKALVLCAFKYICKWMNICWHFSNISNNAATCVCVCVCAMKNNNRNIHFFLTVYIFWLDRHTHTPNTKHENYYYRMQNGRYVYLNFIP